MAIILLIRTVSILEVIVNFKYILFLDEYLVQIPSILSLLL
jgi:hypothetical protein